MKTANQNVITSKGKPNALLYAYTKEGRELYKASAAVVARGKGINEIMLAAAG